MKRTLLLGLFVFSALVVCNCSDYFTPWTAFRKPDLDPSHYPGIIPTARSLGIGDSIGPINLEQGKIDWYAIQAKKDTTYVISANAQFDVDFVLVDSGDFSYLASGYFSTTGRPSPLIWTCDTSKTVYLRIAGPYSSYGPYQLTVKTFQTVYGNTTDIYEPDSRSRGEEIYPTDLETVETYSMRRLDPGDTDWFYFSGYDSGTYTIRTVGNTDTKICLLSENVDSVVATDDNSGGGLNAKLSTSYVNYDRTFCVTGGTSAASGVYGVSITHVYN